MAALLCLITTQKAVQATDTTEPFALGFSDAEFYLALDGLGPHSGSKALAGEIALGIGVLPRLSLHLSAVLSGDL